MVVDGPVLVAEALASGLEVLDVFVDDGELAGARSSLAPVVEAAVQAGIPVHRVVAGVLAGVLDPVTPQGIAAVVSAPDTTVLPVPSSPSDVLVVLDGVGDPGNAGALMRTAEAAGACGLAALGASVDILSPKVVRSSAGSVLRLGVFADANVTDGLGACVDAGWNLVGTRRSGTPFDAAPLVGPVALVLGSEAHGVSAAASTLIPDWVGIPTAGDVESLNVAVAGAVVLFELARRARRPIGDTGSGAADDGH
jgi:TrmH family RNA methyltransferase